MAGGPTPDCVMLSAHKKLVRYCLESGDDINWGRSDEEAVAELETRYGINFPADFREYLLEICPTDFQMDHNWTQWWSLSQIKSIPESYRHRLTDAEIAANAAGYLFFADYLIWSWAWAICCLAGSNYGRVVVISGKDRFVANSFAEFIDGYIRTHGILV
jgi:hypothetical protein